MGLHMSTKAWLCMLVFFSATSAGADGASLYREYCASCHGDNLEGDPDWRTQNPDGSFRAPPHNAEGHTWHHADSMLFDYVKLGGEELLKRMGITGVVSGMPGYADQLTDQEITSILDFIKSTWPKHAQEYQAKITENNQ